MLCTVQLSAIPSPQDTHANHSEHTYLRPSTHNHLHTPRTIRATHPSRVSRVAVPVQPCLCQPLLQASWQLLAREPLWSQPPDEGLAGLTARQWLVVMCLAAKTGVRISVRVE
jgi:hypothetical protein